MKSKVIAHIEVFGTIEKITSEYVVVIWDNVNGHWHYTQEQAKKLKVIV